MTTVQFTEPEQLIDHIIKNYGADLAGVGDRTRAREGFRLCGQAAAAKRISVSEVVQHVQEEYRRLNP